MFKILPDTHKKIVKETYNNIMEDYNLTFNLEGLLWGSIAPDFIPYYKIIRHYKNESLKFVSTEIYNTIYLLNYLNLRNYTNINLNKYISRKIGIICHYLSDYNCYPHAYRKTFIGSIRDHIKYESELSEYVRDFKFKKSFLNMDSLKLNNINDKNQSIIEIQNYINTELEFYLREERSFKTDLNCALNICQNITETILETTLNPSKQYEIQLV